MKTLSMDWLYYDYGVQCHVLELINVEGIVKLNDDLKQMTPYERRKLQIDFVRFVATLGALFLAIVLGYAAKH